MRRRISSYLILLGGVEEVPVSVSVSVEVTAPCAFECMHAQIRPVSTSPGKGMMLPEWGSYINSGKKSVDVHGT